MAFSAALVLLPSTALGVVALMTPTATVCLMSRTANLEERELEKEEHYILNFFTFREEDSR